MPNRYRMPTFQVSDDHRVVRIPEVDPNGMTAIVMNAGMARQCGCQPEVDLTDIGRVGSPP